MRQIYAHSNAEVAGAWVDDIGRDFTDPSCPPEFRRLGRTIPPWRETSPGEVHRPGCTILAGPCGKRRARAARYRRPFSSFASAAASGDTGRLAGPGVGRWCHSLRWIPSAPQRGRRLVAGRGEPPALDDTAPRRVSSSVSAPLATALDRHLSLARTGVSSM